MLLLLNTILDNSVNNLNISRCKVSVKRLFFSTRQQLKKATIMDSTYIGMSSRHLINRVREHLNFKSLEDSAIKDHILSCEKCSNNQFDENNFVIIRKCKSEFCFKNYEALLIKKLSPKLNQQMFANGASFLLNIQDVRKVTIQSYKLYSLQTV